ncbi:hypothetical protein IJH24_02390 [Candidatus Saccharibacteria bacterium]|nr:hypothetical protein [Candidatus Saccharibacteria bacterium]
MKNLFKKLLISLAVIGTLSLTTTLVNSEKTYAASSGFEGRSCQYFLGMTSWDCGFSGELSKDQPEADLQKGIWTIAANIATDITVIAAYLVLGYVIYGGYLYTFSAGDPGKVANGKKTLAQAFIGLAIVMSAYIIMSTIRIALIGDKMFNCAPLTGNNCIEDADSVVVGAINWFIAVAGIASAIFLVYGGIQYTTSAGDSAKLQKAKQMIIYSLIGLAIVALSFTITAFVANMIRNANTESSSFINQNIISKEVNENKIN